MLDRDIKFANQLYSNVVSTVERFFIKRWPTVQIMPIILCFVYPVGKKYDQKMLFTLDNLLVISCFNPFMHNVVKWPNIF